MKKLFTLLLGIMLVSTLFAQKPSAIIQKASVAPVIGGDIDEVWDEADPVNIDLVYIDENPTVGELGETYWKGLWTEEGIYVLVYVADDDYYPYYQRVDETQTTLGRFDQVEVFFDCNFEKIDGGGGREGGLNGHYKFAPASGPAQAEGYDDGTLHEDYYPELGYQYSINASEDPHYFVEYFAPFSSLKNSEGAVVDITGEIGFEVSVIDNDEPGGNDGRNRMVWSNWKNGGDDSWDNMDEAGLITLDGADVVYIDEIILTGGDITEDDSTFQIGIELISTDPPNEPLDKTLKWFIDEASTAKVKLSADGLVTPLNNGTLILTAESSDGYVVSNEITINISNQKINIHEVNYIVDGYFNEPNEDLSPQAWPQGDGLNGHTAYVEDGVFYFSPDSALANPWNMKVRQAVDVDRLAGAAGERFAIGFKMWATEECAFQLVLEQQSGSWNHWGNGGTSQFDNAVPVDGQTRWNLTVTTEPTWFKLSFVADNLDGNRADFGFQPGTIDGMLVGLDSLYLIEAADSALVDWTWTTIENNQLSNATLNVYPNPATDRLNVTISGAGTSSRVAIYNSVGLKMEEIEVVGNHHVFDVSNYSPGLYFVKTNNKVVKFVR